MFGFNTNVEASVKPVEDAAEKATFNNLRHAGFSISKRAKQSIEKGSEPSEPGKPPRTRGRGRANIRAAIFTNYDRNTDSTIIGPRASYVGDSMRAHEFGETYRGVDYDERPVMEPALQASIGRFAADWQGTITR